MSEPRYAVEHFINSSSKWRSLNAHADVRPQELDFPRVCTYCLLTQLKLLQSELSDTGQPAATGTEPHATHFELQCLIYLERNARPSRRNMSSKPYQDLSAKMDQIWNDLSAPSARAFRYALAQENIPTKAADIDRFVKSKSERAIFAPPPEYKGKVVAFNVDHRWQADLISFVTDPAREKTFKRLRQESKPFTMVLLVQDLFSRYIWATPLTSTNETAEAFKALLDKLGRSPQELDTDGGSEFTAAAFKRVCDDAQIQHSVKDKNDRNGIATVDSAIRVLKRAIKRRQTQSGKNWLQQLQPAVDGYNKTRNESTQAAPDNFTDDIVMSQQILNAEKMKTNMDLIDKREATLKKDKGFRTQIVNPKKKGLKRRADEATWSSKIHVVQSFPIKGLVRDTEGKDHKTKLVKSAPLDSTAVQANPKKGTTADTLRPFAIALRDLVGGMGKAHGPALRELKTRKSSFSALLNATNLSFVQFVDKFPDLLNRRNGKIFANTQTTL